MKKESKQDSITNRDYLRVRIINTYGEIKWRCVMRCTDRKASTFVLDCRELTGSKIRKMMAKLRITFRLVTLHGARGSTSGGQGRRASSLGAAAAFLPTKQ